MTPETVKITRAGTIRHLAKLLNTFRIGCVLDVGANKGQYAHHLRSIGYRGRIVSFEPVRSAYKVLAQKASSDERWEAHRVALGAASHQAEINVTRNLVSSTLNDFCETSPKRSDEGVATLRKELITVRPLDEMFHELKLNASDGIFLKVDTQGYESQVLAGSLASIPSISLLQLEMSLVDNYRGERTLWKWIEYCQSIGFELATFEPSYWDSKSGRLLQVDGVFYSTADRRPNSV